MCSRDTFLCKQGECFKLLIKRIVEYEKNKRVFNSEFDENDNLLYIWSNNVNESLQILAAKNYIENTIGSDKIQIVYGKK